VPRDRSPEGRSPRGAANATAAAAPIPIHHAAVLLADLAPRDHARLAGFCCEREVAQAGRFLFAEDRSAYLAAHGLLRLSLSTLWPLRAPAEWRFAPDRHGKPSLTDAEHGHIRFNLSHCRSRVAVVLAEHLDCGIDVEPLSRDMASDVLLASCLSDEEKIWLDRRPAAGRGRDFLRLWTLKEAISKAVGLGLSLPFETISLDLSAAPILSSIRGYDVTSFWLNQMTDHDHVESIAVVRAKNGQPPLVQRLINFPEQKQHGDSEDQPGKVDSVRSAFR
jgi:4'-phosphopantetheinyl transferase